MAPVLATIIDTKGAGTKCEEHEEDAIATIEPPIYNQSPCEEGLEEVRNISQLLCKDSFPLVDESHIVHGDKSPCEGNYHEDVIIEPD
jgi:hypothetical protein